MPSWQKKMWQGPDEFRLQQEPQLPDTVEFIYSFFIYFLKITLAVSFFKTHQQLKIVKWRAAIFPLPHPHLHIYHMSVVRQEINDPMDEKHTLAVMNVLEIPDATFDNIFQGAT